MLSINNGFTFWLFLSPTCWSTLSLWNCVFHMICWNLLYPPVPSLSLLFWTDHFWPEKQQQWNIWHEHRNVAMNKKDSKQLWLDICTLTYPFNIYLLSMELCTVKVGDTPCHLCTGRHRHQAVTLWTRTASICNYFGAQNLLGNKFIYTIFPTALSQRIQNK